jgi:hypothetical protein
MKGVRMADKEVRIKLNPKTYAALRDKARREMRSLTKQVTVYIQQGLKEKAKEAIRA